MLLPVHDIFSLASFTAGLPVCLPVCRFARQLVSQSVCLLSVLLPVCLLHVYLSVCVLAYLPAPCLPVSMSVCLLACLSVWLPVSLSVTHSLTYSLACLPVCLDPWSLIVLLFYQFQFVQVFSVLSHWTKMLLLLGERCQIIRLFPAFLWVGCQDKNSFWSQSWIKM